MPCQHNNVTWPQGGWQYCTDCAARRPYDSIGAEPGPWVTEPDLNYRNKKTKEEA